MMTEEQYKTLEKIYNQIKNFCIAFELWGSSILPWVTQNNDIDILVTCNTKQDVETIYNLIDKKQLKIEKHIDLIIICGPTKKIFWYQSEFKQPLFNSQPSQYIDFFNEKVKKDVLVNIGNKFIAWCNSGEFSKIFYHFYIILKLYIYNSYELTQEDIEKINKIRNWQEYPESFQQEIVNECLIMYNTLLKQIGE